MRLLGGVGGIEGLEALEADVGVEARDEVAHLLRVLDVPVGMRDAATPPASWISSDRLLGASASLRATKAFAPGTRYSSKNGPRSGPAPAARAMCGRPIESAAPASRDRVVEGDLDAERVQPVDDLVGAVHPLLLRALARGRDPVQVDPVAEHVQVVRVAVNARHLDRRHALDARRRSAAATASRTPATASWSVSDITVTPASAAARATSAGSSWPSETTECAWRSIKLLT